MCPSLLSSLISHSSPDALWAAHQWSSILATFYHHLGRFFKKYCGSDRMYLQRFGEWAPRHLYDFNQPMSSQNGEPLFTQASYFLLSKSALPSLRLQARIPYSALSPLLHLALPLNHQGRSLLLLWTFAHTVHITTTALIFLLCLSCTLRILWTPQGRCCSIYLFLPYPNYST